MESAQTGQVGRSHPRGSGLDAGVDMSSAIADIVGTSLALNLTELKSKIPDLLVFVATQMRWFYVILSRTCIAAQRMTAS
jgi:hypothetical protein